MKVGHVRVVASMSWLVRSNLLVRWATGKRGGIIKYIMNLAVFVCPIG